ncbi:MAG TPA: DUF1801 domain-containing protein [Phycisphaerales bacterium]|nr:DUF1801 domain-containing protein [Phycisphaerales bacterium]
MRSQAQTVAQYLAELPAERREIVAAVREAILKGLDKTYTEAMQYGMIGYCVPHSVYPAGYHCDPRQPLPFVSLASQKNHVAVYLMSLYGSPGEEAWFRAAWAEEVVKGRARALDMGKSCVRFKKLGDVPLNVITEAIRRMPAKKYIAFYDAARPSGRKSAPSGAQKPAAAREAKAGTEAGSQTSTKTKTKTRTKAGTESKDNAVTRSARSAPTGGKSAAARSARPASATKAATRQKAPGPKRRTSSE